MRGEWVSGKDDDRDKKINMGMYRKLQREAEKQRNRTSTAPEAPCPHPPHSLLGTKHQHLSSSIPAALWLP